jgi:aflatoxin B1 aldehyde reductase
MYQSRYFKDHYFNAIEIIRPVAEKHHLTLLEVALRWMIHHSQLNYKERDGVIIGCSSLEQLESNLNDFEKGPLPEDVVQALDVCSCVRGLIVGCVGGC